MFDKVIELLDDAVDLRIFPGCTAGVIVKGRIWTGAFGHHTYEPESLPVEVATVYDVASITKAIPVSCCALKLIEDGLLAETDRLIDIVPEFTGAYREGILIRHLLTHTIDFGFRLSGEKDRKSDAIIERILTAPLRCKPGTVFSYANASSILLGMVIERISGLELDVAADRWIFTPLSMSSTTFHPENLDKSIVAPSEIDPWRNRVIHAEVHDESAFSLRPKIVGSAGLFSTTPDLLRFIQLLLEDGTWSGVTLFKKTTITAMHTNMLPASLGTSAGMGWELDQPFMGKHRSRQTFGKTGFTGCSVLIDPWRNTGLVLLSNYHYPRRQKDRSVINQIRSDLADIVFAIADTIQ